MAHTSTILTRLFVVIALLVIAQASSHAATYYSQSSSDPAVLANWNSNTGGGGTTPSNFTTSPDIFIIQNGHIMTTTATWSFGVAGMKLQINNGGSLVANHAITINSGTATFQIDNGGTYIHNNTTALGSTIFNGIESFGASSNFEFQSYPGTVGGAVYGNLTINNSSDAGGNLQFGGSTTTINGNFRVQSLFGSREIRLSAGTTLNLTVAGNFTVEAGILDLASSAGSSISRTLNIGGNFSHTGGTIQCTGTSNPATINMTGSGKTWASSGTLTSTNINWTIGSGASITLGSNMPVSASRTLTVTGELDASNYTINNSGTVAINGIFKTSNSNGLSGASAAINGGTIATLGASSTIEYYFHGSQTVTARNDYQNITIAAAGTKTLGSAATVAGTMSLNGGTFATGGFLTLASTGSIIYSNGAMTGFTIPAEVSNFIAASGSTTLTQNLTVTGTLILGDNTLDIAGNTLAIHGDLTIGSSGVIKSNGSASITVGGVGALSSTIKLDQTTPGTTNRLANLTINRITSGTATLGSAIELTGTLTLTNGTLTTGGNLTLVSNASGTARMAPIPGTADISGNVTTQRFVASGSVATRRYRMLSSPNQNFTFAQLADDIFITGTGGVTNGFDASSNNSASCHTYQESTSGGRGWKPVTHITDAVAAGTGMLVFVRGDRSLSSPDWFTPGLYPSQNAVTVDYMTQPVNKGNISPTLTYTNTGDGANDGWNLVGNPYPSQIDWTAITKANLDPNYYIYDPATGSYVSDNGSNFIASGQAFFVQATAGSPTLTFTESCKISSAPTQYFKNAAQRLSITMVKDAANSDIAWIEFNPGTSKSYNRAEDARKFPNALINLGFYIDSTTQLQRSSVPVPLVADTFPIAANAPAGSYVLEFGNVAGSLPQSKNIFLKDLFNNNLVNLRTNSTYPFTITTTPSSSGNRFLLIVTDPSQLPVEWLSFTASIVSNLDVKLNWQTSQEKNNSHFIVERSTLNGNFEAISQIAGAGTISAIRQYAFTDHDVFATQVRTVYYRIRQVDKDARTSYSQTIAVSNKPARVNAISLYPNPCSDFVLVANASADIKTEVIDAQGKVVNVKFVAADGKLKADVSALRAGVYMIRITDVISVETSVLKFTKE